ncbi:MAG TPA: Rieske 2Fe-2S domain-containing protein [Candidatus Aquilonibacter sp.]|nr:Rieske 2Fe-2S domain-containing protein [Candidatus Aquilonibacter sp.]
MMIKDRVIAFSLIVAMLGAVLFIVAYATGGNRLFEGLAVAFAAAGLSGAAIGWAFWIFPDEQVVDERDVAVEGRSDAPVGSARDFEEIAQTEAALMTTTRRGVLTRMLYAALGLFGIAMVVPVRSFGPALGETIPFHTKWRKGSRMQREDGTFVKATDLNVDSFTTVFPEGAIGDEQSQTMLIRVQDGLAQSADGYLAYSKVCTHAGCPVALYRTDSKQMMCPCHQSVFDVVRDGKVVSGPADHALPRLPIEIAPDGYVVATGDFPEPVGPGFWNEDV